MDPYIKITKKFTNQSKSDYMNRVKASHDASYEASQMFCFDYAVS